MHVVSYDNPTPSASDKFGSSVSVSANHVLIGAPFDDTDATDAGSVYLYDHSGTLLRTYSNPTPDYNDQYGVSVSIYGSSVLIGAPYDDTDAFDAGIAYLYDTSGTLLYTLHNPTPEADDRYGTSLALSGSYAFVGAFGDSTNGYASGSCYLFSLTGTLLVTINNPYPAAYDYFGSTLSISGDYLLIGASADDTTGSESGSAYLFDITGTLITTYSNPTPATTDIFGSNVALSGSYVLIGSIFDDTGAENAGSAYLYE